MKRFIVTVETGKHRWFRFLEADIRPDNRLVCIASDDPFVLGVLSSRVHTAWARATGGLLEDRPVYAKTACFDRFPFPAATSIEREEIAALAEDLDGLRREVLDRHEDLTMTGIYNARLRLASGNAMSASEWDTHARGCIGLIDHLHTRIDALVTAAYGWPDDVTDEAIVSRLLELNTARAVKEQWGDIRWLRPDWQKQRIKENGRAPAADPQIPLAEVLPPLPAHDDVMATALLDMLRRAGRPMQPRTLVSSFAVRSVGAATRRIERVLAVLAVAGSVHRTEAGWYAPRRMI